MRCQAAHSQGSGRSLKRDYLCRCVLNEKPLGDLAVPERVDVRPRLLECAARRLDEASLVPQRDYGDALRDELTGLELLELKRLAEG